MRRLAVLASVVVVLAGLVAYVHGDTGTAAAQDSMAGHPVVGL